jgi:hypothetical protein
MQRTGQRAPLAVVVRLHFARDHSKVAQPLGDTVLIRVVVVRDEGLGRVAEEQEHEQEQRNPVRTPTLHTTERDAHTVSR